MVIRPAAAVVSLLALFASIQAHAAELKVFSSTSLKAALEELGPQFEKTTENKLVLTIGPAAVLKPQIDGGAPFDVAILTPAMIDALVAAGKIDPTSRARIARAGLGVAVRADAAKPDVSTADALKRALLNAKSVGFNSQGASRAGIEAVLAKLGIADEIKSRIKLLPVSAPVAVAAGDVEIGLGPVSEIFIVPGTQVAGAFPAEYQWYLEVTGGVASDSKIAAAARALIKFLTAPSAIPVLKAKGMEPG